MTTTAKLLDRLLLRHAVSFEFSGALDGCGFMLTVTRDAPESPEGEYVLIRKDGMAEPDHGRVLCDLEGVPGTHHVWAQRKPDLALPDQFAPQGFDGLHEACELALELCEGEQRVQDYDWDRTRVFTSLEYRILKGNGNDEVDFSDPHCLYPGQEFYIDYDPRGGKVEGPFRAYDVGVEGDRHYVDYVEVRRV